ncbi:MAG TPA: LacI family transcriptional regulator, partial [Lentisphaeria bacterium]|nr:LacI family transcriptional regulator [Lentisphaeria bacterium]
AAAAGRLELELEGCGKLRQIVVPGRLIVRASTAPPPGFSAGDGGKGREL